MTIAEIKLLIILWVTIGNLGWLTWRLEAINEKIKLNKKTWLLLFLYSIAFGCAFTLVTSFSIKKFIK